MNWMQQIVEQYGQEYVIRQLAEESAELCQACLKTVRSMHGETPVTRMEAQEHMLEEIADVKVILNLMETAVLSEIGVVKIAETCQKKAKRMAERMLEGLDND